MVFVGIIVVVVFIVVVANFLVGLAILAYVDRIATALEAMLPVKPPIRDREE